MFVGVQEDIDEINNLQLAIGMNDRLDYCFQWPYNCVLKVNKNEEKIMKNEKISGSKYLTIKTNFFLCVHDIKQIHNIEYKFYQNKI